MSTAFRRSSFCQTGACVEWGLDQDGVVLRDSKHPDGPALRFTPEEWRAFVLGVKADEFPA